MDKRGSFSYINESDMITQSPASERFTQRDIAENDDYYAIFQVRFIIRNTKISTKMTFGEYKK
jgi:hypothetical protein